MGQIASVFLHLDAVCRVQGRLSGRQKPALPQSFRWSQKRQQRCRAWIIAGLTHHRFRRRRSFGRSWHIGAGRGRNEPVACSSKEPSRNCGRRSWHRSDRHTVPWPWGRGRSYMRSRRSCPTGITGKLCIHPAQLDPVHDTFCRTWRRLNGQKL